MHPMNREEQIQQDYETIDLIDYIRIILKRKWLIFGFVVVFLILAGTLTFSLLKRYTAEALLEIGVIEKELFEDPLQVVEKIKSGVYGNYSGIKVENLKNTNLVKIEIISEDPESPKKALEEISKSILQNHEKKKAGKEAMVERDIKRFQVKIDSLKEAKEDLGAQLDILEKIPPYQKTLPIQLALSDVRDRIGRKEGQIENLYLEISSLQGLIEDIIPTRLIKDPTISAKKTQTRFLFNMVVAGVLGLFVGIVLAFGKEWWEKNKLKLKD